VGGATFFTRAKKNVHNEARLIFLDIKNG
jgi:hypothetical protein